jgi:hypothetical protein
MRNRFIAIMFGLAVAGCAKNVDPTTYVSANDYQGYTCPELTEEASRVSSEAARAAGQDFTGDKIAIDVGRVVFFPVLVFTKGNYLDPAEVARLNRSMKAIEEASINKNCGIDFQHTPPPSPKKPSWQLVR